MQTCNYRCPPDLVWVVELRADDDGQLYEPNNKSYCPEGEKKNLHSIMHDTSRRRLPHLLRSHAMPQYECLVDPPACHLRRILVAAACTKFPGLHKTVIHHYHVRIIL